MQREVKVDNKRWVLYSATDNGPKTYQIRDITKDRFGVIKSYILTMGKNYNLSGYTINNNETVVNFEIDNNHPLYISFLDILYDDKELIINDDSIKDNNRKYLKIYKNGDKIILQFVNNSTNDKSKLSYEKFNIIVKRNANSKIDQQGLDTKERLYDFFSDVNYLMVGAELEDSKTYVKKRN